ncbi:MAG TPA: vitamin K epoxide reductase family protein [Candidatus Acidoferrales bacterium]|nr:vitamin K epoxide reductase family protein [Candidatus Acidoferrales bacterium]
MSKARQKRPNAAKRSPSRPALRAAPNWPLFALSIIGMGLTGYLTFSAWAGAALKGCAAGSACDIVLSSRWSTLFGLPTSFWGFATYGALGALCFVRRADTHWQIAWSVAFFGTLYSIYLTGVSLLALDAACPYCLTSLGLMAAILALVSYQRPADTAAVPWRPLATKAVPAAIGGVLLLHLHYIGVIGKPPEPEDPTVRALAEHLTGTGAKFYGASWCPHCQEQKELFGASAKRLPYIECSPGGRRGPQARQCQTARIETYPTWIIQGLRHEGVLSLKQLSDLSGFQGSAAETKK